jgi:DNA-binding transcriptional LysR family regulator
MALLLAQMVKQGYGVAWLPESAVAEDLASGKLVQAADDTWTTTLEIRAFRAVNNTNKTLQEMWMSLERDRKQTTSA